MPYSLNPLPLKEEAGLETRAVLKKAAIAHRFLAELKGVCAAIPNEAILINSLAMQEAKGSSAVENIVTTHDELYKAGLFPNHLNPAAKEVQNYIAALKYGFNQVRQHKIIRLGDILGIQQILDGNNAGLRKLPGTELKNQQTGEVVYTPPQDAKIIVSLMANLVDYMNTEALSDSDPLVKMAIIHFQFESIHPFYDGNGRTGRIMNILYLVTQGLLDLPVLYLSRHIILNRGDYYKKLQGARDAAGMEAWLIYMLEGVEITAKHTIALIGKITALMLSYKNRLRQELPKIYSQDFLNNIFRHPYTKIDFLVNDLSVSRLTATKYLEQLVAIGLLTKHKVGRSNYYINTALCEILSQP